jgi:hypothetical protein
LSHVLAALSAPLKRSKRFHVILQQRKNKVERSLKSDKNPPLWAMPENGKERKGHEKIYPGPQV